MSRLKSLLMRSVELLEEQATSFSRLDRWMKDARSVPDEVREEWKRICELQDFLRREQLQKIVQEASSSDETRDDSRSLQLLRESLGVLARSEPEELLGKVVGFLEADRGVLLTCSEESGQARVLAAVNLEDPNLTLDEFQVSRTVFQEVLRTGRAVLIADAAAHRTYAVQTSIMEGGIRTVLAVPVRAHNRIVGILYLDSLKPGRSFSGSDLRCLTDLSPLIRISFFAQAGNPPRGRGEVFLDEDRALRGLIGDSPEFVDALALLKKVAPTPAPVLLIGESGTGKELFARALHALSTRRSGPFVPINCAAIPDALLESELFGHERGAFTGAETLHVGKFERASRGTLLLDEIGEMRLDLQAKLLRFLESGEIDRVGGGVPFHVDARIVAATNQDLAAKVTQGGFRQDLYYRLNVFAIHVPPLRRRKPDVRLLAGHFYRKYAELLGFDAPDIRPEVYRALESYEYPGNVRELENIVYRSLLLSDRGRITLDCLADELRKEGPRDLSKNPFRHLIKSTPAEYAELTDRKEQMKEVLRSEISSLERRFSEAMVERAGGNITKAAELAGIDRGQFHRMLKPVE